MGSPTERILAEPLRLIRLHDPQFAPLDATGARRFGGRWNSPGAEAVYTALTYGGALLETRVHAIAHRPPPREITVITVPAGVRIAELAASDVEGWDDPEYTATRAAGDAWLKSAKTIVLIVPSRAGAPLEKNAVINLAHPDTRGLHVQSLGPVPWDTRLFVRRASISKKPRKKK